MKTPNPQNNNNESWRSSCETNWTIANGSLAASVTFESSDFPIDSQTTRKPPLILKPPSPDSGPCDIKLSFTQKHGIRQVYVRSTARIYEIYYAPDLQSCNDYLCTVHCSIAAREEELLHTTDSEEAVSACSKGSNGELAEVKFKGESNIGTNEDDWVEVKVPDSPLLGNGNTSLTKKNSASTRSIKDFYEATAEITDADPCMSLTLRLVSLQNKGCVYVDEVYVFADPLELVDSENQAVQVGNSAGSSLMAMLVPTILQLSKSGVGRLGDNHASNSMEKREYLEIGSITSSSTSIANGIQNNEKSSTADRQEVKLHADMKLQEVSGSTAEPPQFQIPAQVSVGEEKYNSVAKNDLPYCQVETVLEQLVSRVSRIEDLCLRFEENMLKPINSMEARLQRVEQQLEVLSKNSQYSGLPSCTRFSAPAFSCIGSNSSSSYNDGSVYPPCGALEFEKKDIPSNNISKVSDYTSASVSAPQLLPSLVVTAPEFLCGDEEEENNVLEPQKDCPQQKPKQPLSIDDALAAAIAGFSSMASFQSSKYTETLKITAPEFTSEGNDNDEPLKYSQTPIVTTPESTSEETGNDEPSKYTQTLKVTAPEFTSGENVNDDKVASPSIGNGKPSCANDGNECIPDSVPTSRDSSSVECVRQGIKDLNDDHFEEISRGVDVRDQFYEGQTGYGSLGTHVDCPSSQAKYDLTKDDHQITVETSEQEARNIISNLSFSKETDVLKQLLGNQMKDSSDITRDVSGASTRDAGEGSDKEMLTDIPKSSYASVVDFEIPLLEVKFSSWENFSAKSPLETLLTDVSVINFEAPFVQESDDGVVIREQINLTSLEDGETTSTLNDNPLLLDLDSYDVELPSDLAGGLQDDLTCIPQEVFVSFI